MDNKEQVIENILMLLLFLAFNPVSIIILLILGLAYGY